ncbi:MAG: xanthine dehydrogenase family protein molybdopterin-binding subunit [Salinirussus sp.]
MSSESAGGRESRVRTVDASEVDPGDLLGSAVERREDPALLTGEAEFTDDIDRRHMAHLAFRRSRYGHADIEAVETADAEAMDGVIAVYTGDDVDLGLPCGFQLEGLNDPDFPAIASDRVRYAGDAVAAVVAEDRYTAHAAADAIEVRYDRRETVTDPEAALEDDAPELHADTAPGNVGFEWAIGNADETERAFDDAAETVELEIQNQRLIPNAMEPRAAVGIYRPSNEDLEVHMTSQNPHLHRLLLSLILGHPEHKIRVRAPEVGGGFGSKIHNYAGETVVAWAAMEHERPIKWQATRSESYQTDAHGRAHATTAELAVDDSGSVTGLRVDTKADLGGYLSTFAPLIPTYLYAPLLSGQYEIPAIHCEVTGVFTNTAPTDAYRGAGRPEASYVVERLMTHAARELGYDPAEFRRRNFVPEDAFPYETPVSSPMAYDSGEYEKTLDAALEAVDYEEFRERQAQAREEDRYLGLGISCYIEACGVAPSQQWSEWGAGVGHWEFGSIRFRRTGTVEVHVGTSGHGQGHHTSFAQIVASELGVPYEDVEVVEGDTDEIPEGTGTYGSRSAAVGGAALLESAEKVIEKGRTLAAHQLEVAESDIEFDDGEFHVTGAPDQSVGWADLAGAAYLTGDVPDDVEPGLEAQTYYDPENYTFPFGTHIAVVEVDTDSGEIEVLRYVAVDDVGPQLNPKIVEGQVHGGIVQGLGQAMLEGADYDENGQLLTGTMQDYAVPKAHQVPEMELDHTVTESPHNPLGVKGVGEAGTIAAPQAVVNAVTDALEPFGVESVGMPLTAERVHDAVADRARADGGTIGGDN